MAQMPGAGASTIGDSVIRVDDVIVNRGARGVAAEVGLAAWDRFPGVQSDYPEQVFTHVLSENRNVEVAVVSPTGLGVRLAFDSPRFRGRSSGALPNAVTTS